MLATTWRNQLSHHLFAALVLATLAWATAPLKASETYLHPVLQQSSQELSSSSGWSWKTAAPLSRTHTQQTPISLKVKTQNKATPRFEFFLFSGDTLLCTMTSTCHKNTFSPDKGNMMSCEIRKRNGANNYSVSDFLSNHHEITRLFGGIGSKRAAWVIPIRSKGSSWVK